MKWKVCGMRDIENIEQVAACEPDFMGFIFVEKSPRFVGWTFKIPTNLPEGIKKVGVFVNESVERIVELSLSAGFNWVQLHGDEPIAEIEILQKQGLKIIKAISVESRLDFEQVEGTPDYFLFDTKVGKEVGGTGKRFDWGVLGAYVGNIPFFLAGGLSEENMKEAAGLGAQHLLFGLDFNSKLEISPGVKDLELVKKVTKNIKLC